MQHPTRRLSASYLPLALFNLLLLIFLALAALYLAHAARAPDLFACAFARNAHLYCPGCGGSRAALALLRLDIVGSLRANLAVLVGAGVVLYYELALFGYARGRRVSALPLIGFAAFLLVFFILRNILFIACGIDPLGVLLAYWS